MVFHGKISPQIAKGIKVLRKRIAEEKIPPMKLDETLNIATWNIREFGRRKRTGAAIHYIAEILFQFGLVAVTELRDNLSDLQRVMKLLGPNWNVIFSDYNTDHGGNRERIAYLYDKRAVQPTGLAAEAEPPRIKQPNGEYLPALTWWRSPYMASFQCGSFDFVLMTVHIRWASSSKPKLRIPELKALADWIADRADEKFVEDKDIVLMGDFNIPKVDDELYKAITSRGLEAPKAIRGMTHGSNLEKDKRYDQIFHHTQYTKTFQDKGGALDFYDGDWRALFPSSDYPDMTKKKFTYELSDHLPLWVHMDTWVADEQLDQMLSKQKK